jgi:hypothetical protein
MESIFHANLQNHVCPIPERAVHVGPVQLHAASSLGARVVPRDEHITLQRGVHCLELIHGAVQAARVTPPVGTGQQALRLVDVVELGAGAALPCFSPCVFINLSSYFSRRFI